MRRKRIDPHLPPAILLGGGANALSLARSLRAHGIRVVAPAEPTSDVRYSRFCEWVPLPPGPDIIGRWLRWLTDGDDHAPRGAVLLPCGDDALELIVKHRRTLQPHFRIYEANDEVLAAMLDKASTYILAKKAGIPAPEMWIVNTPQDLQQVIARAQYPCGLKPRVSHEFKKYFGTKKLFVVNNHEELRTAFNAVYAHKLEMIVTELIPGGDRGYCSYYSYLDENGEPLFHFTKRKIRQYPTGFGFGSYHLTDWNPEVAELGLKFFQRIGIRGLANVEFKRDPRDGTLKLIECNHRFTEANEQIKLAGIDLGLFVYNKLTGRPLPDASKYRRGVVLMKPIADFLAFRSLHKQGELTWREWLRDVLRPVHFLYFKWWDPLPALLGSIGFWRRQLKRLGM